jgi:hypothetical protein
LASLYTIYFIAIHYTYNHIHVIVYTVLYDRYHHVKYLPGQICARLIKKKEIASWSKWFWPVIRIRNRIRILWPPGDLQRAKMKEKKKLCQKADN